MKYNTADADQKGEAMSYFMKLVNKKCVIEVKKVNPKRSLNQNSYLHLILGVFGLHFGYTAEEAKMIYKKVNKDMYFYQKKGTTFMVSSADINKEEMAKSIDRFMLYSEENGCELPPATDTKLLRHVENEIEKGSYYL